MNIEERKEFKNLTDKDKKEVLNLMAFMQKFKEQERSKELYATYEEYMDLVHISEDLNNRLEELIKFKLAWEELKGNTKQCIDMKGEDEEVTYLQELDYIQELEQKYNLGGE